MNSKFNNVAIKGFVSVFPENKINIDDEIQYFDNSEKKLNRAKKMIGFGTRYVVAPNTTVVDLAEHAANILIGELDIDKTSIDALILVTQSPDYLYPASSCILHGRLGLDENCATFDVGLGCSGYVYGLWLAHSLIASGGAKKVLLLAGDDPSTHAAKDNRISNPLFGDAASATLLEYTTDERTAYFSMGTRGSGWDRIIAPATGRRLPLREDIINIEVKDTAGNPWHPYDEILKGMDVFNFTMDVVPKNIEELLNFSKKNYDSLDFVAVHQANKQIVETIIQKTGIPREKTTSEVFSKYGNNSTNSVVTVLCDSLKDKQIKDVMLSAFGVGLSWGSAIINLADTKNLGIRFMKNKPMPSREDMIKTWTKLFKGE